MNILKKNPCIADFNFAGKRAIILIPSISIGEMSQLFLKGLRYYEERYLYFLMFLKNPESRLLAVLSSGYEKCIIDYFIKHAAQAIGVKSIDLERRFTIVDVPAREKKTLTQNILHSKSAQKKIIDFVQKHGPAFIEFWRVTPDEIKLSKKLGAPYYGLRPSAFFINTKSGARKLFKKTPLKTSAGFEDLKSFKHAHRKLKKLLLFSKAEHFLIKINNEGGGIGILKISREQVKENYFDFLKSVQFPVNQPKRIFLRYFEREGGVVEEFIERDWSCSPSVQFEITPDKKIRGLATHEQILEGTEYLGTKFPAPENYRRQILQVGKKIVKRIGEVGGQEFIAIDLLVTKNHADKNMEVWGIEINARKGGANHTHMWAKYLTGASYDEKRGVLVSDKRGVLYQATEYFLNEPWIKDISPKRLLKSIQDAKLDFNHKTKSGVFVHLLSPLSHYGKFGVTVIGHSEKEIAALWVRLENVVRKLKGAG